MNGFLFSTRCLFLNFYSMIYNLQYMKTSTTVKLLAAKAVANIFFVVSLTPTAIVSFLKSDLQVKLFYYRSWTIMLFSANTFGTSAAW